jgi:crotonobetaine/carnitine-CoA ligase
MMEFVWRQPPTPDDANNRLRCIFAIPTAAKIAAAFRERFGVEAFVEGFGSTEVTAPILTPYGETRPPGATGLALADWYDIRVADPDTGEEVPLGAAGELLVRPKYPNIVSAGYLGAPRETTEAWRDLWWHTGDAVRRDKEGWYYFVDRLKDALRRRGENISSFEVEQPIVQHPDVVECAVIGVPAGIDGGEDEVMAVIVPREGSGLTPGEIWSWCESRVPAFATPRYVRFISELPRTPSEKVLKRHLRAEGVTDDTVDRTLLDQPTRQRRSRLPKGKVVR